MCNSDFPDEDLDEDMDEINELWHLVFGDDPVDDDPDDFDGGFELGL